VVGLYGDDSVRILRRDSSSVDFQEIIFPAAPDDLSDGKRLSSFVCPLFHPSGEAIFTGRHNSSVSIHRYPSMQLGGTFKVASNNAPIRQLEFSSSGMYVIRVSCSTKFCMKSCGQVLIV
jgi:hypothetical protein